MATRDQIRDNIIAALRTIGEDNADLYRVLQVDPLAELAVIAAAYRKLMQSYHPDKDEGSSGPDASILNIAYGILRDPVQRSVYDEIHQNLGGSSGQRAGHGQRSRGSDHTGHESERGPPLYVVKGYALGPGMDCRDIRIEDASLAGFDLRAVVLSGARFVRCDFTGCDLRDSELLGTRFRLSNIEAATLAGAWYSNSTSLPIGFRPRDHGMKEHPDSIARRRRREQSVQRAVDTVADVVSAVSSVRAMGRRLLVRMIPTLWWVLGGFLALIPFLAMIIGGSVGGAVLLAGLSGTLSVGLVLDKALQSTWSRRSWS